MTPIRPISHSLILKGRVMASPMMKSRIKSKCRQVKKSSKTYDQPNIINSCFGRRIIMQRAEFSPYPDQDSIDN